jgi:threonine efflux protein
MVLGQFSPGPDMMLLTRTALREGTAAGVKMATGVACGLCFHTVLAIGGVTFAFQALPWLRGVLQWVAALYLLWLAFGMAQALFSKSDCAKSEQKPAPVSERSAFLRGMICNLLNPKAAVFLAAVCAPFLTGSRPTWWPYAMGAVVVGLAISLWSLWVVVLQWAPLKSRYERSARWIDGTFALVLLVLAIRLMVF